MFKLRPSFLFNIIKFNVQFKNLIKTPQKIFWFPDNCIWIDNGRISFLWGKYLSPLINVFESCPKDSDVKKDWFFPTRLGSKRRKRERKGLYFKYEREDLSETLTNRTFSAFELITVDYPFYDENTCYP